MAVKMKRLSKVKPKNDEIDIDSVFAHKSKCCDNRRATDILLYAQTLYSNMQRFREDR